MIRAACGFRATCRPETKRRRAAALQMLFVGVSCSDVVAEVDEGLVERWVDGCLQLDGEVAGDDGVGNREGFDLVEEGLSLEEEVGAGGSVPSEDLAFSGAGRVAGLPLDGAPGVGDLNGFGVGPGEFFDDAGEGDFGFLIHRGGVAFEGESLDGRGEHQASEGADYAEENEGGDDFDEGESNFRI